MSSGAGNGESSGAHHGRNVARAFSENLLSFLLSSLFGVLVTVVVFYLTAPPTTSAEIRARLVGTVAERVRSALELESKPRLEINTFLSEQIDISAEPSIVIFGSFKGEGHAEYRFIAVFELATQRLIDRLIGRSSFYELGSLTYLEASFPATLLADSLSAEDIDGDGTKEIHLRLKSTFADSVSIGPLFLKKHDGIWKVVGVPSLQKMVASIILDDKSPHPYKLHPIREPFPFFGMPDDGRPEEPPPVEELAKGGLYEDEWQAHHNGTAIDFVTLRNGGTYTLRKHPVKGHTQIAVLGFFADENSVLGKHYCMVTFLRFSDGVLVPDGDLMPDLSWNWGFPMISDEPLGPSQIDLDSIADAGIVAHKVNATFFDYTDFQQRN